MKNIFSIIACVLWINITNAQEADPIKWESVKLKSKNDYKNAESTVRVCASYLLSHRYNQDDLSVHSAGHLVIRWMEGTKEYHFAVQGNISKYHTKENGLLVIYMAALTSLGIDSPAILTDGKKVEVEAMKMLAKYCDDPAYKVEKTAAIEKLITAYKGGTIEDILDKTNK